MSRFRASLRVIVLSAAAIAVSCVPVVRAFAWAAAFPPAAAAFVPAAAGGSSAHLAHRMPRLRRPKQSLFALLPESGPVFAAVSSVRRPVPARERPVRPASFAELLDHPPA
jgi:hypothetical protein